MGGIRTTGISVECDRCQKVVSVNEQKQADFYRTHSERGEEQRDVRMFIGLLNNADGETRGIDFEYLCPKCCEAIFTYMGKIDTSLAPKKDTGPEEKKQVAPPPEDKKSAPAKEVKGSTIKITDERGAEPPPENSPAVQPGADFVDNDLFT